MTRAASGDPFDWAAYEAEFAGADRRAPLRDLDGDDEHERRRIPPMNDLYELPPHWGRLRRGDRPE